jgi:hypothetical protein
MDAMMQIMLRMEEKCNRLEAKCDSLENILKEQVESLHTKIDETAKQQHHSLETILKEQVDSLDAKIDKKFKQHEYNNMLAGNQSWEYSARVYPFETWMEEGCDGDEAEYLSETSDNLREITESLRRGKFPNENDKMKKIIVELDEDGPTFNYTVNNYLQPHWREFSDALKQFTPAFGVLPDDCETSLCFCNVQLNHNVMLLIKDALMNQPFQRLVFMNHRSTRAVDGNCLGMSVDAIVDISTSNKHLRKLDLDGNDISRGQIGKLCFSVHAHPSLVDLDLRSCFEDEGGLGDEMMVSLLTSGTLKLERLVMSCNGITSNVTTVLSDFLATDPPLKELDLGENHLNDNDAVLIANALRSNTSLRMLDLVGISITDVGRKSFRLALNDDSTLNSISDSNHSCKICLDVSGSWNMNWAKIAREKNRGRKIYTLLSSRHKSVSNVQHFGDIDVELLPVIVGAVQKYASFQSTMSDHINFVKALSIVYELMRKWDKVFPLYDLIQSDPK